MIVVPVIGSLIVGLTARFGSDKIRGHGIPEAIEAILYGESRLSPKVAVLKPISSAISIGSGGPFGAEGPIIMTRGAIGSIFAQRFRLTAVERKTLLVAGASAGMTGIFGTPIAAILLAVEVMLFEWKPRSFVPVVVAALIALAWRPYLVGNGPLFPFHGAMTIDFAMLALAAVFGILAGFIAAALSSALYRIEDAFHCLPMPWMWWPALGAVVVGIGGSMLVRDAIAFFERAEHRSYPVVDSANRPIALASRSDALRWGLGEIDEDITLDDRLSDGSLPVVDPSMPAVDIATFMINENLGRVCVVDSDTGTLVGLIARRNLLQARAGQVRQEQDRKRS